VRLHENMGIYPVHATDLFLCLISKGKKVVDLAILWNKKEIKVLML
jgi:hypothetical protein